MDLGKGGWCFIFFGFVVYFVIFFILVGVGIGWREIVGLVGSGSGEGCIFIFLWFRDDWVVFGLSGFRGKWIGFDFI